MLRMIALVCAFLFTAPSLAVAQKDIAPDRAHTVANASPIRPLSEVLPDVWQFLDSLDADVRAGALTSTAAAIDRCRAFYSAERMARIETAIPGWGHMASFEDGKTLWHVNLAMVALLQLDEYRAAAPAEKVLLEWTVLLHDIAKEPVGGRDHRHSFRSGAKVGRLLPSLGFPVTGAYATGFEPWFALVDTAVLQDQARSFPIQDNNKLPSILADARQLFAEPTLTAVAVIALHQSVTSLAAWPVAAPLSREQVRSSITPAMLPALRALTLADSGGWNLFDPPTLAAMYAETRAMFEGLAVTIAK